VPTATVTAAPPSTPAPSAACRVVPDLKGKTVAESRTAWTAAGFTGSFDPPNGQDNKIVSEQSEAAGACLPETTAITVTF
jgi:beta-lactam-binding protein with PASTA domain